LTLSDRQQQIIDAAVELIADQGIQHLTIRRIGEKVGISEPAIYRHFPSKIEILLSLLDSFGRQNELVFEQAARRAGSVLEELQRVLDALFRGFAERPAIAAVIFAEDIFRNDPRLVEKLNAIRAASGVHMLRAVRRGQESGQLRGDVPAEQMRLMIMGSLRLLVLQWRLGGCATDLIADGRKLWTAIEKLLAQP
jgi:AcrR family transcriptional regulator